MNAEGRERSFVVGSIAAVLLVVVVAIVVSSSQPSTQACAALQCGPIFSVGNPSPPRMCADPNVPTAGCLAASDYFYALLIESSSVTFGQVLFKVVQSDGLVDSPTPHSAFAILNANGRIVATFNLTSGGPLEMSPVSGWSYFTPVTGISASSILSNIFTIVIDMGSVNPAHSGYEFVATVANPVSVTGELALP